MLKIGTLVVSGAIVNLRNFFLFPKHFGDYPVKSGRGYRKSSTSEIFPLSGRIELKLN